MTYPTPHTTPHPISTSLPTTIQALQLTHYKQPFVLGSVPMPTLGADDVLVQIHATSVNPLDFKIQSGELKLVLPYALPHIMGNDVAGTVVQVGKHVKKFAVGDEIYARPRTARIGSFAEYIAIHQDDVALKPASLSFTDSAGLPLVALTAYQALFDVLKIQAGQKVLILAGAGGVGTIAIQMAKIAGAYVATTASPAGFALVKSLGSDEIINYKTDDFAEILSAYDAVLDTQGGKDLMNAFKVVKSGAKVVSISGMPTAQFAKDARLGVLKEALFFLVSYPIIRQAHKHQANYAFLFMRHSGSQLDIIREWIAQGKLRPVTDKVFDFKDIMQTLDYAKSGRVKGKVVINLK